MIRSLHMGPLSMYNETLMNVLENKATNNKDCNHIHTYIHTYNNQTTMKQECSVLFSASFTCFFTLANFFESTYHIGYIFPHPRVSRFKQLWELNSSTT